MALVEVDDLKVHYPVRRGWFRKPRMLKAVDGVSFSIDTGEILGLVGESGCGKSTLGRALVHLEKPAGGKVTVDGTDLSMLHGEKLRRERRKFQMIFQDPYGSLNPRLSIFAAIDEVLRLNGNSARTERREKAAELLEMVGLPPEALDRYPHQFSGGQRQRIGIARALAAEPRFIVADEPVSALDVSVQASIINLFEEIRRKTGISFLFIAHDLAVVEHISRRIMVMYLGRIVESGPAAELVATPRHPYTRILISAVPRLERKSGKRIVPHGDVPSPIDPPSGCLFHPRCPRATEECRKTAPPLLPLPGQADRYCACFHPEC